MEAVSEVANRMDVLKNIAARAWPNGVAIGFCPGCGKEREYDWDALAKMMSKGMPRHCGQRIELKDKK